MSSYYLRYDLFRRLIIVRHRDQCKNGGISGVVQDYYSPDYSTRVAAYRKGHARGNAYALR
jgi:hypothetical protein